MIRYLIQSHQWYFRYRWTKNGIEQLRYQQMPLNYFAFMLEAIKIWIQTENYKH